MGYVFTSEDMASLNEKDREWFSGKIQAAITLQTSEWIKKEISDAIKEFRPKRWRKAADNIVAFGSPVAVCALIVTLLVLTAGAIYQATAHVKEETEFRSNTKNKLDGIDRQFVDLRALISANRPERRMNQDAAKALLAEAKRDIIPPITESVVKQAGGSFIEAAVQNPGAWSVALDFAGYRSFLNLPSPSLIGAAPLDLQQAGVFYTTQRVDDKPKPNLSHGPPTSFEDGAKLQMIGEPVVTVGRPDIGFQFLILSGGTIDITNTQMRHVFLRNTEVHYREGSLILEDVTFIDCTFIFDNTEKARRLAEEIISTEHVTLSV